MIQSSVEIRSATADELPYAVAAIVAAFVADPPARFAWPSPHDYLQAMPVATHAFAGSCVEFGTAYVSTDLRGAALWLPPGAQADGNALTTRLNAGDGRRPSTPRLGRAAAERRRRTPASHDGRGDAIWAWCRVRL